MNTIQIDEMSTLNIQVTEEIESKNLHTFIKTTILNNNPKVSKNTCYHFFYNENNKMYEIVYFDNLSNSRLELFDIVKKFNNNDNMIKVLISDKYFILCKNDKVLSLKKTNDVKIEEVKRYIEQIYKIKKCEFIVLTQKDKELFKVNNKNTVYDNCYNLYSKKSFNIFCLFFISTFIFFSIIVYFTFYEKEKTIKSSINNDVSIKIVPLNISKQVITLFNSIKNNNLIIEQISYNNDQLKTILYHQDKQSLLLFANNNYKKIDIKSLKYNEQKQMHQMEVNFEY